MGSSRLHGGVAAAGLIALLIMSTTIGAHTDEALTDPEGDLQTGTSPLTLGASCPRTDFLGASFTAFHNRSDGAGGVWNGTEMVIWVDDLAVSCPTESQDREEWYDYEFIFHPDDPEVNRVRIEFRIDEDGEPMSVDRWIDKEGLGVTQLSCDGPDCFELDLEASTISYDISTDAFEGAWRNARFISQMWTCTPETCFESSVSKFGDRMPDRGGATLFAGSS